MFYSYFKYCLEHKIDVFKVCWHKKQYWHAFTHDLSKFSKAEFVPYAKYFYGPYGVKLKDHYTDDYLTDGRSYLSNKYLETKKANNEAWQHHYLHNKHHWIHWCHVTECYSKSTKTSKELKLDMPRPMSLKYIKQMICDWEAMGIKFGGTAQEFYLKNYKKIELHPATRFKLEIALDLITNYGCQIDVGLESCTLDKLIQATDFNKKLCDKILKPANEKYKINIYDIVAPQLLRKESDANGGS